MARVLKGADLGEAPGGGTAPPGRVVVGRIRQSAAVVSTWILLTETVALVYTDPFSAGIVK